MLKEYGLIKIQDSEIPKFIRILFSIPTRYWRQYPLEIPAIEIISSDFSYEFKTLLRRLKEDNVIEGSSAEMSDFLCHFFRVEGLSEQSIKNALKKGNQPRFKFIKEKEYYDIIRPYGRKNSIVKK